jgi:hypothetical protein
LEDVRAAQVTEGLDELERVFIAESHRAIERAKQEKEEVAKQKRRLEAWRTRFLFATTAAALLVVILLAIFARGLATESTELKKAKTRAEEAHREVARTAAALAEKVKQQGITQGLLEAEHAARSSEGGDRSPAGARGASAAHG